MVERIKYFDYRIKGRKIYSKSEMFDRFNHKISYLLTDR